MTTKIATKTIIASTVVLFSELLFATTPSDTLLDIQHQWAQCYYEVSNEDNKIDCLEKNIMSNQEALNNTPDNNELKVWLAINNSTLAGAKGGLGALSLVKKSKKLLEQVIATDPTILDGSAYTSLGSLYYQVPGWPIGFGNDDKAEKMLKQAITISPNGIDSNYFYADFLLQDGQKDEAIKYFKQAQLATPRPNRPIADKGRQQEITNKLKDL
ncbi:tetratricopeptide repeat protein [Psychromonas sp. PT13]|uniref:tetratricopeptide repeat protein n=1 Tax=Psychromonas sp. PT13 TaxID=3439547 RepID=UPI003EBF2900